MILSLMLSAAQAQPSSCEQVGYADLIAIEPPAVVVLGERFGTQPDLRRADRVLARYATRAGVTLALEAVGTEYQPVLDQFAEKETGSPKDIAELVKWDENWGFPFGPYEPLVTASSYGVDVIAAGLPYGPRPEGATVALPPSYMNVLRDILAGQDMPIEQESKFVQAMAWRDWSIANNAVSNWDEEGYLVIVAGRAHVEGGKGIPWQVQRMTKVPVHAFMLSWAQSPCYPGDKVWKPGLFEAK